jgi:hypothetical protein
MSTIHMGKNTCVFCGHIDERHAKCNYCSQCGRLGDALYRKLWDTDEGREVLAKFCSQRRLSSY